MEWAEKQGTAKGGFLWVQYNSSFAVSWQVSMIHSLHCLHVLRNRIEKSQHVPFASGHNEPGNGKAQLSSHIYHCLDYIEQVRVFAYFTLILTASSFLLMKNTSKKPLIISRV
jgi:hypothetical protein